MKNYRARNIRGFIGAKNFNESREFYRKLGWEEITLGNDMSLFQITPELGFYLQDYYVKDWVNNSMLFVEVDDIEACNEELRSLKLDEEYTYVRFTEIKEFDHGREVFMHDPSGVLWHFCQFK